MVLDLYSQLCSYQNLYLAYQRARKGKTQKQYVLDFEQDTVGNMLELQSELLFHAYKPRPLQEFILRDPKTRKINRSAFRDRIVHHALYDLIEPIFEKHFIFDSYANRIGKGAFKAIDRFYDFHLKISHNNNHSVYVLKADVRKYFEYVDHDILLSIVSRRISDQRVIWLIKTILSNYNPNKEGVGMPLGNLTSQFFANVYLVFV
ncbi:hypothetical protein HYX14_03225 [Candidatus Woesearchaeota archaeon]|nr:hypothetical protein [Candidatus Woesearchaeota archaeon]